MRSPASGAKVQHTSKGRASSILDLGFCLGLGLVRLSLRPRLRPQMVHAFATYWIYEAMGVDGTTAGESVGQDCQALEAEARVAISTEHLVALRILCLLPGQILL